MLKTDIWVWPEPLVTSKLKGSFEKFASSRSVCATPLVRPATMTHARFRQTHYSSQILLIFLRFPEFTVDTIVFGQELAFRVLITNLGYVSDIRLK